jgi:hypothetical protein
VVPADSAVARRGKALTKCPPRERYERRVLRRDKQAAVYEGEIGYGGTAVYGCTHRERRAYFLGWPYQPLGSSAGGAGGVHELRLAGTVVAYANGDSSGGQEDAAGRSSASWIIEVRSLRNGRLLHSLPTGSPEHPKPGYTGIGPSEGLVVKSDGAVAWIVNAGFGQNELQVHAADRSGSRVLASGSNIAPHSLRLNGSKLSWMQGGSRVSARLN